MGKRRAGSQTGSSCENGRAPLWRRISEANFTADHTIIGGDFNHLEEMGTRGTTGQRRMHRRESTAWHQLTLQYGLTDAWTLDSFRKMSKKEFTFDNGRKGQGLAVSRIDKFLVCQKLDARGGRIEAAPSIRRISDHSPLVLTIWGRTSAPPTPATYFDIALLKEEDSRSALLNAWTGTQPPPPVRTWNGQPGWRRPQEGCSNATSKSRGKKRRRRGPKPKTSNKKSGWRRFSCKETPKTNQQRKSSRWHKATWPICFKNRSQGTTNSARPPGSDTGTRVQNVF